MRSFKGFTLAETIVVVSVLALMTTAIMNLVSQFYRSNAHSIAQAAEVDNARRGMEAMVRDMREMTYADDGSYPLENATANDISFFSDIDHDNSVELVRYRLSTTTITRYVTNATGSPPVYTSGNDQTTIVSEYVRNIAQATSTFRYLSRNGTAVPGSTVTDVAFIDVNLIINVDPTRDPGEYTLRSSAAIRNVINDL